MKEHLQPVQYHQYKKIRGAPHPAAELFTGALREASLFDDLLRKVGGDRSTVERLIEYERRQKPGATRLTRLQNAISRWEQEINSGDQLVSAIDLCNRNEFFNREG